MQASIELKSNGLKVTAPRVKILEIFRASETDHLSAEDVYRLLLASQSEIGLATVYRVLTQFEQAGILLRNHFETGKAVYELRKKHHHDHLMCLDCGRVEEFFDEQIEKLQKSAAGAKGFVIADHALSIYAHCIRKSCPYRPAQTPVAS